MDYQIKHNKEHHQFEIDLDGQTAVLQYRNIGENVLNLYHTFVPSLFEGKGIGSQLVKGALDEIRANGQKIVAGCSFVEIYVRRHPEYKDLLAS